MVKRVPHASGTREGLEAMDRNERTADFPPAVMEEIRRLITPFALRAYPEPEAFYRQLAQWLEVPREQLLLSAGADGAFRMIFDAFVEPGDEVVHAVPSYGMFPVYCELSDAVSQPVTFNEDLSLPLEKILEAITPKTKLVVLANPNQPIERLYTPAECRQLLDRCKRQGALLVMDEAYHHFCDETALPLLKDTEHLVVVRTFSKAFGLAGLRLGFLASSTENVRRIEQFRPMYEAHSVALAIGGYLLKNDQLMKEYVAQVKEARQFLVEALKNLQILAFGQWGNSVLAALPKEISSTEIAAELKKKRFLVRAEKTPPLSNHLRITLGTLEQAHRFFDALKPFVRPEPATRPSADRLVERRTTHGSTSSP